MAHTDGGDGGDGGGGEDGDGGDSDVLVEEEEAGVGLLPLLFPKYS